MKTYIAVLISVFLTFEWTFSQNNKTSFLETEVSLKIASGTLHGTLTTSLQFKKGTVALIIAGSGPTDRNGNNVAMENNSLKNLAHDLAKNGIATLRYDKRGIAASQQA